MAYTIKQAIYDCFQINKGKALYYSDIVKFVNEALIKRNIHPKRSSTIDREIRNMAQNGEYIVNQYGMKQKFKLYSNMKGSFWE